MIKQQRNEEARGLQQMNRTPGAACAFSGRTGRMQDKRIKPRTQQKAALNREFR